MERFLIFVYLEAHVHHSYGIIHVAGNLINFARIQDLPMIVNIIILDHSVHQI